MEMLSIVMLLGDVCRLLHSYIACCMSWEWGSTVTTDKHGLSLADRLALHELPGRYGDAVDDRDWAQMDSIFTKDAVFEVRGLVTLRGVAEIKRYMAEEGQHPLAHLMCNIHAREDGDGARLFFRIIAPVPREDKSRDGYCMHFGSYYDWLVKTAQGWRVRHRIFSAKRLTEYEEARSE